MRLDASIEWEVPGDAMDAVCSSDEEKSVKETFKAFMAATGLAQPKGRPKRSATTTHQRGPLNQLILGLQLGTCYNYLQEDDEYKYIIINSKLKLKTLIYVSIANPTVSESTKTKRHWPV